MEKGDEFNNGEMVVESLRQEICFSALSEYSATVFQCRLDRHTFSKADAPSFFVSGASRHR